jgi:hypothetical protein
MRHHDGCMTITAALALALTLHAAPVARADPPPLAEAEAAIGAENCGLPLGAAWGDPPPLARAEAMIWAENCRPRGAPDFGLRRVGGGHKSALLVI